MTTLRARLQQSSLLTQRIVRWLTTFQAATVRKKNLLRAIVALPIIGASVFWASMAHAQSSCGEVRLYLDGLGDITWCNEGQQYYTYVNTATFFPYSQADPLVTTFTGGKSNVREPYYPSYETTSGACDEDRDKFSPTITIRFNKPVANVRTWVAHYMDQAIDYTLVADNGATAKVSLAPFEWTHRENTIKEVVLPGDNITTVTITPNSVPNGQWHYLLWHDVFITPPAAYTDCNCNKATAQRPPTQNVSTGWPLDLDGIDPNWNMLVQMSDKDGLVLKDVKLGQRYMAEQISVPYFYLETSALSNTRGELKPDGSETVMRSRLVNFYVNTDSDKLVIEAQYVIDRIPATSLSCLHITQRYEFYKRRFGDQCEPTAKLPCSRWKPIVKYQFFGRNGEFLKSLNIAQRQHRTVDNNSYNTVGLFRDNDTATEILTSGIDLFARRWNPLDIEWDERIISNGQNAQKWDNIHQTFRGVVDEPWLERVGTVIPSRLQRFLI